MYRDKYRLIVPFLAPSVLLYVVFVLYPYLQAMYISLTRWRGLSRNLTFIGLENFQRMLNDELFWNALSHNAIYLATLPLITIAFGLFLAFLLTQGVPGAKFYRVTFFFPQVMSVVAIGVLWSFVYHPTMGILTSLLKLLGVAEPPVWLGNPDYALTAIGVVVIWQAVGFYMVLFIAGMESIPSTYYEAATIDGASKVHIFFSITLPLLWDTVRTALVFLAIGAVDMFAIVQTMTGGGPSRSTDVLATYLYERAFLQSEFGYATAIAVSMFLVVLTLSTILLRVTQREKSRVLEMATDTISTPTGQPILRRAATTPGESITYGIMYAVLIFWSIVVVFPMIWLLYTSFKTDQEIFFSPWTLPAALQWGNFERAWVEAHIGEYFFNSVVIVLPSIFLTLLFSSMTAYVLGRFPFPLNRFFFYLFLSGLLFPIFLALVPLFFLVKDLGMLNTYHGLILVYTAYSLPFSIFFLTGFFKTLPSELHEAGIIDGANPYQVFFRIMLPLAQPGLISIGIFNFLGMWNQYILPLVLISDPARYLLTQGLAYMLYQQFYGSDWSGLFAALTIVMIPTVLAYVIFQGQIQKGITVGALKG